jgi:hypothetical protein
MGIILTSPTALWFALSILLFSAAFKSVLVLRGDSVYLGLSKKEKCIYLLSPIADPIGLRRANVVTTRALLIIFLKIIIAGTLLWFYQDALRSFSPHWTGSVWILCYLACPAAYLTAEFYSAVLQLLFSASGVVIPSIHNNIFGARSLSDFWGNRWNTWVSDLFRQQIFSRFRRRPLLAMLTVFLISAFVHEIIINMPLFLFDGRNWFGSMFLYFLLQALGIWVERRWMRKCALRIPFLWIMVLTPAPLVINPALLKVFGIPF